MGRRDDRGAAGHPRRRRTQEERRAATRQTLLDATIECLSTQGYARTSTTEIVKLAGVSRGAQVHHFPTKIDLVTAAVSHLIDLRLAEFRDAFARMPPRVPPATAALEILWQILTGPTFDAWLELVVAARTRPELRKSVKAVSMRMEEGIGEIFAEVFPDLGDRAAVQTTATLTFALLEGLVLRRLVDAHDPQLPIALAVIRENADDLLSTAARSDVTTAANVTRLKEA